MPLVYKSKKTQAKTDPARRIPGSPEVRPLSESKRARLIARGTSLGNRIREKVQLREYLKNAEFEDNNNTNHRPTMLELSVVYGMIHYEAYEDNLAEVEAPEKIYVEKYKGKPVDELKEIYESLKKQISA